MLFRSGKKIPPELERVITHCLEKTAPERFQSARDLSFALKATVGTGLRPVPDRRGRLSLLGLAAAVVVVLLAVFLWLRTGSGETIDSIAVLPFANASADPNAEYLSDGITESLINSLSQLPKLKVTARSTVFTYKGKDADPRKIGRDLNVRAVLTGRVVERGESLNIQVDLVSVADGSQLWGERYNRKRADILAVEDEIAREISNKLRLRLTGDEEKRLAKRATQNTEAYQLYLQGRSEERRVGKECRL